MSADQPSHERHRREGPASVACRVITVSDRTVLAHPTTWAHFTTTTHDSRNSPVVRLSGHRQASGQGRIYADDHARLDLVIEAYIEVFGDVGPARDLKDVGPHAAETGTHVVAAEHQAGCC